ncbi:MAG TPA: ATP-binding protein [Bacteriovoracaceae bacterium]|nr:ATP-binding protein [Bacteriovoracaceae bacterium]
MSKINILVVDDRPEGIMAVEAVLSSPQYNIVTACSGMEALKRLLEDDFAVILLDVQMPLMNGFEAAAVIKTREKSKDIPIVFMSAINQDEHYVYQGYGVGAVDYLLKPFDPYILKSKVAIFADLYRLNIKIKEQSKRLHENDIKIYAQALDKLELESLRKYQYLADAIPQIVFRLLPDSSYAYFNKVWFEYTGLTDTESAAFGWKDALHPDDLKSLSELFLDGRTGELEIECRIRNNKGQFRWHLIRMEPEIYTDPTLIKTWLGTATDIEERKNAEEDQRLLAEAGELLVSSLDFENNLQSLACIAVPMMADWVVFDIINDEGQLMPVACHHPDKEKLRTLNQQHMDSICNEQLENITSRCEKENMALVIPLCAQGEAFGQMRLEFTDSDRKYDDNHLNLARELGRRISLAYENCRLYRLSQEAIEIRNDFLSIASHELNTPITSLKLQLQMVLKGLNNAKDGKLPIERFHNSVNASVKQVNRLIQLIQVLLDVSRIQSGKFNFNFTKVGLKDIIKEVIERHHEIITTGDCTLEVGPIPEATVCWDKTRIDQVITNLVMNAIKYAPGRIELKVQQNAENINIRIQDHGEGIDPNKFDTIFKRFERASTSDTVGGLGLGLFIVKQIVEGHHGSIQVDSVLGEGSSFTVILPLDAEALVMSQELENLTKEHQLS